MKTPLGVKYRILLLSMITLNANIPLLRSSESETYTFPINISLLRNWIAINTKNYVKVSFIMMNLMIACENLAFSGDPLNWNEKISMTLDIEF